MLFNTFQYALFLPLIFLLYWFVGKGKIRVQNIILLVASYYFYAQWDWRFLFLLAFSTLLDFFLGIQIAQTANQGRKRFWLWLSVVINLGFLFYFKYFNFFAGSLQELLMQMGIRTNFVFLEIILPIGISFYTFHGLSYIIDIYYGRIKPEKNVIDYSLFVSFFPLLVAGPIERANHLLPQIKTERHFSYENAVDGCKQILWGLVKKLIVADNCALYVDYAFHYHESLNGTTLIIAAFLFGVQIYGDFSGYTDIATGSAKLLGFRLLKNFDYPLFSRSIAEFWRRWHISLTSWFRDYVYRPIVSRSLRSKTRQIIGLMSIFVLSGFWHGANWTFILWGVVNGLLFFPYFFGRKKLLDHEVMGGDKVFPTGKEFLQNAFTIFIVAFLAIIFRSPSLEVMVSYYSQIFSAPYFAPPSLGFLKELPRTTLLVIVFIMFEWFGRQNEFGIQKLWQGKKPIFRWSFYYLLIAALFYFSITSRQFLYFQF